jgi:hypothetical protein
VLSPARTSRLKVTPSTVAGSGAAETPERIEKTIIPANVADKRVPVIPF